MEEKKKHQPFKGNTALQVMRAKRGVTEDKMINFDVFLRICIMEFVSARMQMLD